MYRNFPYLGDYTLPAHRLATSATLQGAQNIPRPPRKFATALGARKPPRPVRIFATAQDVLSKQRPSRPPGTPTKAHGKQSPTRPAGDAPTLGGTIRHPECHQRQTGLQWTDADVAADAGVLHGRTSHSHIRLFVNQDAPIKNP